MTADQFIAWLETGENPPPVDVLRREFLALNAIRQTMMEALEAVIDDLTIDADKALTAVAYRAERAAEYALLCAIIQRLADIGLAAHHVAEQ